MHRLPEWVPVALHGVVWASWGMMLWTLLESVRGYMAVRRYPRLRVYARNIVFRQSSMTLVLTIWGVTVAFSRLQTLPIWVVAAVGLMTPLALAGVAIHDYLNMVRLFSDADELARPRR